MSDPTAHWWSVGSEGAQQTERTTAHQWPAGEHTWSVGAPGTAEPVREPRVTGGAGMSAKPGDTGWSPIGGMRGRATGPAPSPQAPRAMNRNVNRMQFDRQAVHGAIREGLAAFDQAQKFRKGGMGKALRYTIGLAVGEKNPPMPGNKTGEHPGNVEGQEQVPEGVARSRADWEAGVKARQDQANRRKRNDSLSRMWGAPARSQEQDEQDEWLESHAATAARQNRAYYRRTVGTPRQRPQEDLTVPSDPSMQEHVKRMGEMESRRPKPKKKPDTSQMRKGPI